MPFETAPGAASLVVDVAGVRSIPATIQVTATAPGVAVTGASHAVAVNYPDGSVNSAASPARPGQYVIVYLTGQGALDNPVATGAPASSTPFSHPTALVLARVGGLPAQVAFAGMVPGWVGVLQMNLMVPQAASGEQPLEVSIGGVSANPTVLSIAAN
jgi:adhesin/invasin